MHLADQFLNQEAGWFLQKQAMRLAYFERENVLHLVVADGPEANSVELSPDVTVEMDAQGQLLGVEILNASRFLRDSIMDSIQGRMLHLMDVAGSEVMQ